MGVLLCILYNLSLLYLSDCDNLISSDSSALRPVRVTVMLADPLFAQTGGFPLLADPSLATRLTLPHHQHLWPLTWAVAFRTTGGKKWFVSKFSRQNLEETGACPLAFKGNSHLWALWEQQRSSANGGVQVHSMMDCVAERVTFDGSLNEGHNGLCDG